MHSDGSSPNGGLRRAVVDRSRAALRRAVAVEPFGRAAGRLGRELQRATGAVQPADPVRFTVPTPASKQARDRLDTSAHAAAGARPQPSAGNGLNRLASSLQADREEREQWPQVLVEHQGRVFTSAGVFLRREG